MPLAEVIYMAERPSTPAVEGLLKKNGWLPASLRLMICTSDFDLLSRAPWMRQTDFPATFEISPWKELTDRERAQILESQENEPWFPEALSPNYSPDTIEPLCSFGLRYNGQVIGWCIVQVLNSARTPFVAALSLSGKNSPPKAGLLLCWQGRFLRPVKQQGPISFSTSRFSGRG